MYASERDNASLEKQDAILKVCEELKTCFDRQQHEINALKITQAKPTYAAQTSARLDSQKDNGHNTRPEVAPPQRQSSKSWTEGNLTRRFAGGDKTDATPERQKVKNRPAAIVIDVGNQEDFPALAKKIKNGMDSATVLQECEKPKTAGYY